ncbi:hypothetical protein LTR70_009935 [Exophiala xenobiotica]|uniref:Uncharacterized protein n=1 Tax=Lithohypha guttulata TaxID=1690604 RepID=A0ABR0JVR5_9EURO|nr:hypothetical protein LTR24_009852 [Lithohypha guttulata]KAK5309860.1 hypothetical protein LTR70_009935 [Exophiala xenobiotica]
MTLKRKSDTFEADLSLDVSDNVTSIEGARELSTLAPTAVAAPAGKRRKVAASKAPSISTPVQPAKKRSRPSGKASSRRPATPAVQPPAQGHPPTQLQPLDINYTTATPELQGAFGHTASAARDDTVLGEAAQRIETGTYYGLSATQPQSYTDAASSWNASHENVSLAPIHSRDTHPHAELVLSLTEEINQLEEARSKLTTANQGYVQHNNNLYRENLTLSQENAALKKLLKEHAPNVQLAKVNVGSIDPSLTATSHPTSLQSRGTANVDSSTAPTIDLTQDETRPLSSSTMPAPLSTARALNPEVLERFKLRNIQSLTLGELQHKHAQLQYQKDELQLQKDEADRTKEDLKKQLTANDRSRLPKLQRDAKVAQLHKEIEASGKRQDALCDALLEFARIERYLTGLCIRYKDLMSHLEKDRNIWDAVEAAKATWFATYGKRNEGRLINGDIASGVYQPPDGFTLEAGAQAPDGPSISDAFHHIISNPGDRTYSFASTDSGAFGLGSENTAPPAVAAEEMPQITLAETRSPSAVLFPRLTYDGNTSSPEFWDNTIMQTAGANTRPLPQTNVFEDGSSMTGPSNTLDYENLDDDTRAVLQSKDNAGTYHGDGTDVLAEVGTGFTNTNYTNSTQIADLDSLDAHLQSTWDSMGMTASTVETEIMPDFMAPQPTAGHGATYYQPETQPSYGINPGFNGTSGNDNVTLPNMPGGFTLWAGEPGYENDAPHPDIEGNNYNNNENMLNSCDAGNPNFDEPFESYTSYLNGYNDDGGDTLMSPYPEVPDPSAN